MHRSSVDVLHNASRDTFGLSDASRLGAAVVQMMGLSLYVSWALFLFGLLFESIAPLLSLAILPVASAGIHWAAAGRTKEQESLLGADCAERMAKRMQ